MDRPLLGLVGHGTDGTDGIDLGIHLRWAFRREVGFPLGGFCLYRRPAKKPPMECFDLPVWPPPRIPTQLVGSSGLRLGIHFTEKPADRGARDIVVTFPPASAVMLEGVTARDDVRIGASSLGRDVGTMRVRGGVRQPVSLELSGNVVDSMLIPAEAVSIRRICIAVQEDCSIDGWAPIACPICLPVSNRAYPCKGRKHTCDEDVALDRLPKDDCIRRMYSGTNLDDLLTALRVVVDPARGRTMASRVPSALVTSEDCLTSEDSPEVEISALDQLLIAAVDPMIARMLGLYHVDDPGEGVFDYKIIGDWPKPTFWSLENSVTFEERPPGTFVPPAWVHENLTIVANRWGRITLVPDNFAGTTHALSIQPDTFDWSSFTLFPDSDPPSMIIRFTEPVGEVQVFARHIGAQLSLRAFAGTTPVDGADTTNRDALLAVHGPAIDKLVLRGDLTALYRVDFEKDFIPHGKHCYTVYGLRRERPAPLAAPANVTTTPREGLTRRVEDCGPPGTGAIVDTRHLVGLRWNVSAAADDDLLARDPVRFEIARRNPDGTMEIVSGEDPITVSPEEPAEDPVPDEWDAPRSYHVDHVPFPGAYEYAVNGIDIFGRQSGLGPWSAAVDVAQQPPPPPAALTARWLDPADRNLTTADRALVADGQAGLVVRWEWRPSQDRQAPYVDGFHVLLEQGWLNHLVGDAVTDPAAVGADAFTVDIGVDDVIAAGELAGMTLSRFGVPYRVRDNTVTVGAGPYVTTLTCGLPNSGMPGSLAGERVSIPLVAQVRGVVQDSTAAPLFRTELDVLIEDLRVVPPQGFVGGTLEAGDDRWTILSEAGAAVVAGGVSVRLQVKRGRAPLIGMLFNAMVNQRVVIELAPAPGLYVDYLEPANWSRQAGPIPSEGTGVYEVFIRQVQDAEAAGRTLVDARRHRVLTDFALLPADAIAYGQVAVASSSGGVIGHASAAAPFTRVVRATPAPAPMILPPDAALPGDIASTFASPPDHAGFSSHPYRWSHVAGMRYIVYRALDDTLFAIDRSLRALRPKARGHWDPFLNQFAGSDPTGALRDLAFDLFVTQSAAPDYRNLVPRNRLLQILASFPDVIDAFTRLNSEAFRAGAGEIQDRATAAAGPGETAYIAQPGLRLYYDRALQGNAPNAYFYRAKQLDATGNVGVLESSTPPVWLRDWKPPTAPRFSRVIGQDLSIALKWFSSREPGVVEYRIFRTDNAAAANDTAAMAEVRVEPASALADRAATVRWVDTGVVVRRDYWYRVIAVNASGRRSDPSVAAGARAFRSGAPIAAAWVRAEWNIGIIELEWTNSEAGLRNIVQRRTSGASWRAVSDWLAADSTRFDDIEVDPSAAYQYRVVSRDALDNMSLPSVPLGVAAVI